MVFVGGFGHHLTDLSPNQIERCLKVRIRILYVDQMLIKVSLHLPPRSFTRSRCAWSNVASA
jgi:hypothetical protein